MYSTKINVTILDKNFVALQSLSTFPFSRGIILRWYHLLCSTSTLLRNNWHNMCSVASYLSLPCKIPQEFFLKLTYTYMLQFTNNCSHIHTSLLYSLTFFKLLFLLFLLLQIRNISWNDFPWWNILYQSKIFYETFKL